MDELQIFTNTEFGELGVIEIDGKYYFPATRCAEILGYEKPHDAVSRHCRYSVKHGVPHPQNPAKMIEMNFIPEGDLYRLITHSHLPAAEKFERWVFDEVLPAIRRDGGYIKAGPEDEMLILSKAFLISQKTDEQQREQIAELETQNQALLPKAQYFDKIVDRNLLVNFRNTAKEFGMKQSEFIDLLLEHKFVYRDRSGKLLPYAGRGDDLFEVKEGINEKTGWKGVQTLITPRGRETFRLLFCNDNVHNIMAQ